MNARHQTSSEFIEGNGFLAEVIRTSRRKTATIKVEAGKVSVVAPEDLPAAKIEEVIAKKNRWIKEKLLIHSQAMAVKPKEYVSGESFSYLGKNYRLKVVSGSPACVKLLNGYLVVETPEPLNPIKTQRLIEGWYREHAEQKFREKSRRYAKQIGVTPASIGIKTFKSRWGSCSPDGHILYNWRVIMAPNRVVDYVVVHELCHLIHHNHSPEFWKAVAKVVPEYQMDKDWLKNHGDRLIL
ncbi:M48 family metallopeptidase [Mariprofundus erugo]|uniref:M48 family metallopeptidase n=1 Tax=Mariprofundus erugo TaxID=2528639 RepID=UPI0010FF1139|nr:SprT family zinc-dependent metalloprotease [Mariprofundus erugo]TLS78291.1 M48 family metallopeptidase [Mariprofundus erugo]